MNKARLNMNVQNKNKKKLKNNFVQNATGAEKRDGSGLNSEINAIKIET